MVALVLIIASSISTFGYAQDPWWTEAISQRVESSGNREEILKLLESSEPEIRPAVSFLLVNMPRRDLESLAAEFLLGEIRQATAIRKSARWKIGDELFFNDVLPYANVDETREPWREKLNAICQPLVADCNSPAEAAQRLNEKLFAEVNVKYSTKRKRANQSPGESIDQGLASCTGLSILLVDACRSVGVPARLAGIPNWPNKPGNHTWVEVWDGQWHFTGAAEPSPQGLDHAWFQSDAALAKKDSRRSAIYAISFKKTDTVFPLVWSDDPDNPIYAVNVTDRYSAKTDETKADMIRVFVRVWNANRSGRIAAQVSVIAAGEKVARATGQSRGDTADMNDMLSFDLERNAQYQLQVSLGKQTTIYALKTIGDGQQTVEIELPSIDDAEKTPAVKGIADRDPDDNTDR